MVKESESESLSVPGETLYSPWNSPGQNWLNRCSKKGSANIRIWQFTSLKAVKLSTDTSQGKRLKWLLEETRPCLLKTCTPDWCVCVCYTYIYIYIYILTGGRGQQLQFLTWALSFREQFHSYRSLGRHLLEQSLCARYCAERSTAGTDWTVHVLLGLHNLVGSVCKDKGKHT